MILYEAVKKNLIKYRKDGQDADEYFVAGILEFFLGLCHEVAPFLSGHPERRSPDDASIV